MTSCWVAQRARSLNLITFFRQSRKVKKPSRQNYHSHPLADTPVSRNYLSARAPSRRLGPIPKPLSFGNNFETDTIDDIDRNLLRALCADARASLTDLAANIGVTRTTASTRLLALEQRGIIQGYSANIHAERLGYQMYRFLIGVEGRNPASINNLYKFGIGHPNITFFDLGIGAWDVELTCEVRDQNELQSILAVLRDECSADIASLEIILVFEDNVKYQFGV
jgi:DNA-binding Lrp family transcriptional regulator